MAIPLVGTSGLFTRLGTIGGLISDCNHFQNTTLPADVALTLAQYATSEPLIDGMSPTLLQTQQSAAQQLIQFYQQLAVNTLNTMANADVPQTNATSILLSLQLLISQMLTSGDSVLKQTVGFTSTPYGTNVGNGVLVGSAYRPDGLQQETLLAESVKILCTQDSTIGLPPGQEQFSITGLPAESNPLAWDWPLGSSSNISIQAIPPKGGQNFTANGDMELWTVPNTPNNWAIVAGTAGTQVLESTAQFYTGLASLQFVGDGTTLTGISHRNKPDTRSFVSKRV
jgi:hypothetical protein